MNPVPADPTPSEEQELDAILDNIDRLAEHVCKKALDRHMDAETPLPATQAFSPARFKKTQAAFQQLSESKLTFDESSSGVDSINNADVEAPVPKPEAPRKSFWPWRHTAQG